MSGLKLQIENDIAAVFNNAEEFAEVHDIIYDGKTYEQIPIVLQDNTMNPPSFNSRRSYKGADIQGVYRSSVTAFIAREDLGGVIPEQGNVLKIDDGKALGKPFFRKYKIEKSSHAMGLLTLELEVNDE